MRGADPDALWRPGFTGTWGYPIVTVARPRRRRWPWGVAAGVLLASAATAVVGFVGGEAGSGATGFPAAAEERWSRELPGFEVGLVARDDGLVVLGDRRGGRLYGLDADDGGRRWEGRLPKGFIADLQMAERAVLALVRERGGGVVLVALDPVDGGPRRAVPLGRAQVMAVGRAGIVVERLRGRNERGMQLLDTDTGDVLAAVRGDDVTWTRSHVRRLDATRLELFDSMSLAPTRSIELAPLGLGGRIVDGVVVPGGVIVAAEERAVLVDEDGAVRHTVDLEATGRTVPLHVHALDPAGDLVAVQTGHRVSVLEVGSRLRELWSEPAWIVDWHVDARHQLVAIAGISGSIVAFPPRILDASTGATRWDGPAEVQDASPLRVFGDGGFIGLTRAGGEGAVVGYDLDRVERWRRSLENGERAVLVAGALVTVDNGRFAATVTLSS